MIRSTFAGFTTAQLAMAASQRALDVTGQNIANINTVGYTKQRLDIASLNMKNANLYNSKNNIQVGYGVHMTGVSQLRDPFLDMQYRSQMSKLGTTDAIAAGCEQLEAIFDETAIDGIREALNTITSSLDTLSKPSQVGEQEFDTMVRSNMQILINLFHENATRLQEVRDETAQGFEMSDIPDLNKLLENIATLNTNIKNSQILGNPALELMDERNNLLDELSSYLPITVKYSEQDIGAGQTVEVMDVTLSANGVKYSLISDGNYGSFDTNISGQPVTLMFQDCFGNANINLTDSLDSGTVKGTLDFLNKSGDFDKTDVKGIGYYEKAFDTLVAEFAKVFNDLNTDINGNNYPLFETSDGSQVFTASNIKLSEDWLSGATNILHSKDPNAGSSDNSNILAMIDALKAEQSFTCNGITFFKGSFYDCYSNIESTLAVDIKSAQNTLQNQIAVLNQTANSRDGVSGVQLDEEGMDLMHYNQSYTAAARLMTTLDEALETLINKTGVVGR